MKVSFLLIYVASILGLLTLASDAKAKSWSELNCGDNYLPVKSVAPVYPKRAQQRGLEGSIQMQFTIMEDGTVGSIEVLEASRKVFVRTATRAVEGFEFPPCIQNGTATRVTEVSIKYDFNLN
jgi:protein TonB